MFSPASRKGEKDKRATLLHHRCSFQGKRLGDISRSGHAGVSRFCKNNSTKSLMQAHTL